MRLAIALSLAMSLAATSAPKTPARLAMEAALHSEDGDAANQALARLSDDRETRQALGLDLVEAWWRVSHSERAINTLSKYRQEAPRSPDPVLRARVRALTGSPFDVDGTLKTLQDGDALCRLMPVAQALDAVGQRDVGQTLLDQAWGEGKCPDADAQRAAWERPREAPSGRLAPVDTPPKRHVLGPGHEPRFIRVMPEQAGELPEGVGLLHLGVPEDHVEALYGPLNHAATTCAEAPLCVTLRHPSAALAGDRLVGPFALRVEGLGEVDAAALLGGITTRLQAEGDLDPWVESRPKTPSAPDESESAPADAPVDAPLWWPVAALCGLALFVGVLWRRRRRDP